MVEIYWYIVIAIIILGLILPQQGKQRIIYVIIIATIHTFVCGLRYMLMTGDLQKYCYSYLEVLTFDWASGELLQEGRNVGFNILMKAFSTLSDGNFQIFIFFIACIIEISVAIVIYKYSPLPWLSYLVWDCMGFYIFGFSAIKQALAMAFVMFALTGIIDDKPKRFIIMTIAASLIHMPALCFLPAYWIAKRRISFSSVVGYATLFILSYMFKNQIVTFITGLYYEEDEQMVYSGELGRRFILIIFLLAIGMLIKGFKEYEFEQIFNLIVIAALFQMLSGFDNIFTRLSDYYFQFAILYFPMLLFTGRNRVQQCYFKEKIRIGVKEKHLAVLIMTVFLVWFYNYGYIGTDLTLLPDNPANHRFMWDVSSEVVNDAVNGVRENLGLDINY